MEKLIARFRLGSKLLKVYSTSKGMRGKFYQFKWDTSVSPNKCSLELVSSANFLTKDGDSTLYRVKEYYGMNGAKSVTSDKFIDINHRVIWTNDDYDEWKACMIEDGEKEDSLTYERYYDDCNNSLYDEKANLDIETGGYIVAFVDLGLWDGRHKGIGILGTNVKDILRSDCDYLDWYCDRYNVRCKAVHHDGTNHYLYRVVTGKEQAERLLAKGGNMTEEEFMKATKSLRPYIAKTYGW